MTAFSPSEIERVRQLSDVGYTNAEIGVLIDRSPASVGFHRHRLGIPTTVRRFTDAELHEIQRLVTAGKSSKEIAPIFDRTKESIHAARQVYGIIAPTFGPAQLKIHAAQDAHIARLRARKRKREGARA